MMSVPYTSSAEDSEKNPTASFTFGGINLFNEGFDGLAGPGRTVDDEDDATYFTVGFNVSPSLALEGGVMTSSEITSSMYSGASGTLHGKSYSVSQGCGGCAAGGTGTVDLKAEIKDSYLLGVKFSPSTSGNLGFYAKAGMLFWDVAYTASNAQFIYDSTAKSGRFLEVDGSNGYVGLGMSYAISKNSSFAFDYLSSEIHDSDISGYSLSWTQSF